MGEWEEGATTTQDIGVPSQYMKTQQLNRELMMEGNALMTVHLLIILYFAYLFLMFLPKIHMGRYYPPAYLYATALFWYLLGGWIPLLFGLAILFIIIYKKYPL